MDKQLRQQIFQLPVSARRELAADLWDSVPDEEITLTPAHHAVLRKRLAQARANPEAGMPLAEFQRKLRALVSQWNHL